MALSTALVGKSAQAAERIVFRYGSFSDTIGVQELTEFAETGRASSSISYYLRRANQNPETVRAALNRQIPIRVTTLNRVLDSPLGDVALNSLSRTIQTPVNAANQQALRGALLISASDNRVSLLEVVHNYPTRELHINGRELVSTYTQISQIARQIQNIPNIFQ